MAFDAGTIMARLDLDDSAFSRKLDADVAKIEAFEKRGHEITIGERVDQSGLNRSRSAITKFDQQLTNDADQRLRGSQGSMLGLLGGLFGGRKLPGVSQNVARSLASALSTAGDPGRSAGRKLLDATGPGIGLLSGKGALITGGLGVAGSLLPALMGPLAALGVGGLGVGVAGLGAKALIGSKADPGQLYNPAQQVMAQMEKTIKAGAQPLVAPLKRAFAELGGPGGILANLQQPLRQMFSGAATLIQPLVHGLTDIAFTVLPLLGKAFRAAAPLLQPLLDGLGKLLTGFLPGVVSLLHAARPAVMAFSQVLGTLGKDLGRMMVALTPAMNQSARLLKIVFGVIGSLLPVIGKLATILAQALGPVIGAFATALKALEPALLIIGRLFGKLAAAVLGDLAAALIAIARLLKDISPSLTILANALGQVFTTMEQAGVFGALSSALEQLAPQLAQLINLVVSQLAPILPTLIQLFIQLTTIMIYLAAHGLGVVLDAVTMLLKHLPFLVPVLGVIGAAWLTMSLASTVAGNKFVAATIKMIASAAKTVAAWVVATVPIVASFVAQAAAATAAFIAENLATLGIIAGIALLVAAIIFLATHWSRVWGDIKNWAMDAWNFLTHGWGQWLLPGLTLIRLAIGFVRDHWKQAWGVIKGDALDAWNFLHDDVFAPIANFITQTLPHAFSTGASAIGDAWKALQNVVRAPVAWVVDHVIDGLISAFDWISDKVGGKHIPAIHPFGLARGGRLPGWGGGDRHPALLEGGETVVSKEDSALPFMRAAFMAAGVPGYLGGGQVPAGQQPQGHSGGWNPFTAIGHAVTGGLHMLTGGGKVMAALATGNTTALINAVTGMIPGGVGGAVGDMAGLLLSVPKTLIKDAVHYLIHTASAAFGSPFTGHYGAGVAQWRGDVLRALAMEHLPAMLASRVLFQMQTESGGNPNAINLSDSNAAAGDPSRGLLQTIMSTFRAYHWPGTSFDIYNPLANIAAAINYAVHTYGPSLMSGGRGMGSGHGYDSGGWMLGGLNSTGRPEAVLTPGQSRAFVALSEAAERLGAGRGGASGGGMMRDLHLTLPEGATIADALAEIGFRLQVSAQRGYTGVLGG